MLLNSIAYRLRKLPLISLLLNWSLDLRLYLYSLTNTLYHFLTKGHFIRHLLIRAFLRSGRHDAPFLGLQVGGGRHLINSSHWLNGDLFFGDIYLDARKKLPLPDCSLDYIFGEQFIEHLSYETSLNFVAECRRVLRPGGVLRLSTPDLDKLISVYLDNNSEVTQSEVLERHFRTHRKRDTNLQYLNSDFVNDFFHLWGHKYLYNSSSLERLILTSGFTLLKHVSYSHSEHQPLVNLERHSDPRYIWTRDTLNLLIEATR